MKRRLKVNGVIIFLAVLLIAFFPSVFFRRQGAFEFWLQLCGSFLILFGQFLRISARGYKAENSQSGKALLQTGPYAIVRNPMYLGILCVGSGIVLVLFNWWVIAVFLAVFVLRYILLTLKEEKELAAFFPQEYPLYKNKVNRLFPCPLSLIKNRAAACLPLKAAWIQKEIGSVAAVWIVMVILWLWRNRCFN